MLYKDGVSRKMGRYMVTKRQKVRVIVFLAVVSAAMIYVLFIMVGRQLFTQEDIYYIRLERQSVSGLSVGQDVRYYGINIGRIQNIAFNPDDISEIIIAVGVARGTTIKTTVTAELQFVGITGLKVIELSGGAPGDPDLEPGGFIEAREGLLSDLTGRATSLSDKMELLLSNLIYMTSPDTQGSLQQISRQLSELTALLNATLGENRQAIQDSIDGFGRLMRTSEQTVLHLDKTILRGRNDLLLSLTLMRETLGNLNDLAIMLKDNPDIMLRGRR